LRRNCLLEHLIEKKIEGGIKVTERCGTRRKQLEGGFKQKKRYGKLKQEKLGRIVSRIRFRGSYRSVVKQTKQRINYDMYKMDNAALIQEFTCRVCQQDGTQPNRFFIKYIY
jgi:hypothetical protein